MEGEEVTKVEKFKLTKKLRKNPYIVTTFVLGLFCIIILVGNVIDNKTLNVSENKILCSVMSATPAWASADGKIIQYGVIIPTNQSIDLVNQIFIPEKIKLLYHPDCSACEMQINYFKEQGTWDAYLKEGLVINCAEV